MESPDSTDAASYASTLKTITDLMPAMPAPARSRAAWSVARAKLDLAAAVRAEGYDLHGAAAAPVARAAAPAPAPTAAVAPLKRDLAAVVHTVASRAPLTPEEVAGLGLAGRLMAATPQEKRRIIARVESENLADRARALAARDSISFEQAVTRLTRRTA